MKLRMTCKTAQRTFYILVVSLTFIWFRLPTISNRSSINPDEAELLAIAKRASLSLIPYRDFTTPTYGVLWPYFLVFMNKLGLPLTLPIAHLLSCLIAITVCVLLMSSIQKSLGESVGFLSSYPFALLWAIGVGQSDYLSLSTELLPLLLIAVGVYLASDADPSNRKMYVAIFLVGSSAWTKYSFAPISFVILLVFLWLLQAKNTGKIKQILLVGIFANLLPIAIFTIALVFVRPQQLIWETFTFTFRYLSQGGLSTSNAPGWETKVSTASNAVFLFFPLVVLFGNFVLLNELGDINEKRWIKKATLVFISGLLALLIAWPVFQHYYLLFVSSGVAAILLLTKTYSKIAEDSYQTNQKRIKFTKQVSLACALLVAFVYAPTIAINQLNVGSNKTRTPWLVNSAKWERATDENMKLLSEACPSKSNVVVWGWSSELYSYYDWMPASRYVNTVGLMNPNEFDTESETYRRNFMRDITVDEPDCIVDATGPSFFPGYGADKQMSVQMPALWKKLQKTYRQHRFFHDSVNPFEVLVHGEKIAIRN